MILQIRLVLLISKQLWNGQKDQNVWLRKESSVHMLCLSLVGSQRRYWDIGCPLALAGQYKPLTGFCHKPYEVTMNCRAGLHTCFIQGVCHSFTQAHRRDSKVQQKTYLLGEQRTRAPSIKVVAELRKMMGFLASGGEFNPEPETRIDRSELLRNTVLLK